MNRREQTCLKRCKLIGVRVITEEVQVTGFGVVDSFVGVNMGRERG